MKSKKSFTLIELLVVIVIIGILAGVIMISTSASIDKASIAKGQVFSSTVKEELLSNTLAEWTFDNLSQSAGTALPEDTTIEDEWGNFDGLSKGGPVVRDSDNCIKGKCLEFSSTYDWAEVSNFSIGNSVTVSFWGKNSNYSPSMPFSFNGDNYSYGPDLYFVGTNINWNTGDGNNNYILNTGLPNTNWHHFVLINDEFNGVKLYIDGVKVGRTASYRSVLTTSNIFYIARYDNGGYYFNGLIDEFVIYDTALSAKQVHDLYAYYFNLALINYE